MHLWLTAICNCKRAAERIAKTVAAIVAASVCVCVCVCQWLCCIAADVDIVELEHAARISDWLWQFHVTFRGGCCRI